MDENQAPRRRRRNREEANQVVAEYEASGMSRQEFCRKHGLAVVTLERYRRRLRKGASGEVGWVAVEVKGHQPAVPQGAWSGLALVLPGGRRIEVAAGFDAGTLHELVGALETF